jgi:hypothetical protein
MIFKNFEKYWNKNGFDISVMIVVFFLFVLYLFRRGTKGTWSKSYYIPTNTVKKRVVPKESKGELECRRVLRKLFNRPFNKARPDILRNPVTGGDFNLELDCYDPELKIAVEYNGIQHYKPIDFFGGEEALILRQKHDKIKKEYCNDNNIKFIEISCEINNKKLIFDYLNNMLKEFNNL